MKELKNSIGLKIKEIRKGKKLTQEQLAEKADINSRHIVRIESGESEPSLDTLRKLANALEVDMQILLVDEKLTAKDLLRIEIDSLLDKFSNKELASIKTIIFELLEFRSNHNV